MSLVPMMLPRMQVDKGAIKFLFKGADMMAPGNNIILKFKLIFK